MEDIKSIRTWLRGYSDIGANAPFLVDYLDDDPDCFAIYAVPSQIDYKRDILGNVYPAAIQTRTYYFTCTLPASADAQVMLTNSKRLNDLIDWISAQNALKNMPSIEGYRVLSCVPSLTPYAVQPNGNAMRYQITLKLTIKK